ncbi:MAG TPA: hypothetical protein VJA44_04215 [Acidimicrobiia bacterium]|nr:hypothetical protein [Acidimicrobiia bacterium]
MSALPSGGRPSTFVAIAQFEGRKLISSGPFWAGVGIALLGSAIFLRASLARFASWDDDSWTMVVGFMMLAILTMVATNRAGLRDHREHTDEQHASLPVGPATRAGGLLLATAWPAVAAAVLLASVVALAAIQLGVPGIGVIHFVHLVLLIVMLGVLGAALAMWVPSPFVAPVLALGLYFVSPGEDHASWHAAWPFSFLQSVELAAWHLIYIASLIAVIGVWTLSRFGMQRALEVTLIVAIVAGGISLAVVVGRVCPDIGRCLL